jgi:tetratricopeptide (TPR) repeat protein
MSMSDGEQVLDSCPSREELKAFSTGRLARSALDRVAEHIEAPCPQCLAALEELKDRADPLLDDLREPPPLSAAEAEDACRCVLRHMLGSAVSTTDWDPPWSPSTATALDKAPPDLPGHEPLMPPIGERDAWPKMGGMGVVWCVHDLQFKRTLAVKVMKAESADSGRVRRFLAEACMTARLAHPSIVPVHAMGRLADGRPYYTMKLVKGQELKELLKAGPDMASQRTALLQVFARVCQALAFAHREGVIHRDLKPGNIMVEEHGVVLVMDWGLAKFLAERDVLPAEGAQTNGSLDESNGLTRDGEEVGTWPYMPPEQANGRIKEMDRRSDVFGLGAILCAILTGKPPYVGPTKADVKRQARVADLAGAYARLEACGADAELIALARACLSAEPNERPPDASAVEERLTGYLASVEERLRQAERDRAAAQARAEEAVLTQQQAEKARRRMLWGAASAGLFLVALLAAGFFAWRDHEAHQKLLADTIDRALTAAMSADLDAAEQATAEAEQAGASAGQVHMLRGQIALHRGQSSEARRHLEEAVQLLPKSVAARGMLAAAYADDGHWDRFDRTIREMKELKPLTAEDFLFKGYAWANLEPEQGLQMIDQAFDLDRRPRPMVGIALLLRAEVRAFVAQDTDKLEAAEGAVLDATYAREFLRDNPTAIWVSLEAHLAKAGVHEHRGELKQRQAELDLAGKDADDLKPFTAPPVILPEAVAFRWVYFREMGREEEVLDELRLVSEKTDHVYANFCCALTLYWRGKPGDFEEALRVLKRRPGTYNDRLLPFVLAEHDYPDKNDWPARARKACEDFAANAQDLAAVMDTQTVLCLLGQKEQAVKASKGLLEQKEQFYTLRREPILRCVRFDAGDPTMTADELVRHAGSSRWDQCLAHYSIAMTKLAEGDRDGAREHFDKAVKTRAAGWGEYDMSWVFRDRLKDPNWPPWIRGGRGK